MLTQIHTPNNLSLYDFQFPTAQRLLESYIGQARPALFTAPAGTGKTYAMAWALKEAQKRGFLKSPGKTVNVLILTPRAVKIQTRRVLKEAGVVGYYVESYNAMNHKAGLMFLQWITQMVNGEIKFVPVWEKEESPDIIILDECQKVKNHNTSSAEIIIAAANQGLNIHAQSATPFSKLYETKATLCAIGWTNSLNWFDDVRRISNGTALTDNSPASMARLRNELVRTNQIYKFEGIKFNRRSISHCRLITPSPGEKAAIEKYHQDYLAERRKKRGDPKGVLAIWLALLKLREACEVLKAPRLAKISFDVAFDPKKPKQIFIASNFIPPLRIIWSTLVNKHKIDPRTISFIIGNQSDKDRQAQVDSYQEGKTRFMLATLKSGGVGLSLHHDREASLQRHVILPPTWSAIELVQALGRAHRINSLTTTYQDIVWYAETVEQKVAARVEAKLRCMSEIIGRRESWIDAFNEDEDDEELKRIQREEEDNNEDNVFFSGEALSNPEDEPEEVILEK